MIFRGLHLKNQMSWDKEGVPKSIPKNPQKGNSLLWLEKIVDSFVLFSNSYWYTNLKNKKIGTNIYVLPYYFCEFIRGQ